jgi:hypothetical protein
MEDSTRLKLIVLGLVLAAIAGAYLFFSGRFLSRNATPSPSPIAVRPTETPGAPLVIVPPIQDGQQQPGQPPMQANGQPLPPTGISDVNSLPATGLPMELMGTIGAAAIVVGYALRRFPK